MNAQLQGYKSQKSTLNYVFEGNIGENDIQTVLQFIFITVILSLSVDHFTNFNKKL